MAHCQAEVLEALTEHLTKILREPQYDIVLILQDYQDEMKPELIFA